MAKHLVLEISDAEIRVLQLSLQRRGEPQLDAAFTVGFEDLARDEEGMGARAERLRERFKQAKLPPGPAAILLPKQNSIVRTVQLPSGEEEELEGMALFEAEKFIPFNVERHIISNQVLHFDAVNGSHVLITAVDGPVMDKALTVTAGPGLKPVLAEVTSIALVRAFQAKHEAPAHDTSIILLHVGRYQTEISILHGDMLMGCRSQQVGVQKLLNELGELSGADGPITFEQLLALDMATPDDFLAAEPATAAPPAEDGDGDTTPPDETAAGDSGEFSVEPPASQRAETESAHSPPPAPGRRTAGETNQGGEAVRAWTQRIVRFTRQTFEFASREHHVPTASRVYLCGDAVRLTHLADILGQSLNVETVALDPIREVPRSPQATVEEEALSGMLPAYGTALRLLEEEANPKLRGTRVNLLPLEVIEEQQAAERRNLLAVSGAMVLIALVLVYLTIDAQAKHSERLRDRYTEYNRAMAPIVEDLREKEVQLGIIQGITSDRTPPLFILDQISTFPGIGSTENDGTLTLTDFRYASNEVTISGTTVNFDDSGDFAEFLERLEHNGRRVFSSVGTPTMGTLQLSAGRGTVNTFTINAILNTTGEGTLR